MNDQVFLFDTTLRDGEQALLASLTVKEKLQIALALERLGVDVIEAGFPVSSPGDFESVQTIAQQIKHCRVCALARAVKQDIDAAASALKVAEQFRIHTFIATSDVHIKNKLKRNYQSIVEMAESAVQYARRYTDDVEFSCEDAGRTNIDDLCRVVEAVINAGATVVNIPDTVGYSIPSEFGDIIRTLFNRVPNIDKCIVSVHCHDDLGLSVANSLAAIEAGARQVEGTINGIGERAGNCALEEVAMILNTRATQLRLTTQIQHKHIYRTSKLVSQLCNMPIQSNKAIVGANAFRHSSGIHQDGMLKHKSTYEIMTPESIGIASKELNLTSRSGRAAVRSHLSSMGYTDNDYDLESIYQDFLTLADRKRQVFDYDLEALIYLSQQQAEDTFFSIKYCSVQSGGDLSTATVELHCGDEIKSEAAVGVGPIDALYQCINRLCGYELELETFHLNAAGEGQNSLGQADIIARFENRKYHGSGASTDIISASGQALLNVMNSIYRAEQVALIRSNQRQANRTTETQS